MNYFPVERAVSLGILWLVATGGLVARADDLQGAQALLDRLKPATPPAAAAPAAPNSEDSFEKLDADVKAFTSGAPGREPKAATDGWVALEKRFLALKEKGAPEVIDVQTPLLHALPPPASWPLIERAIDTGIGPGESHLRLNLMVHTLNNEEDKQWADFDAFCASAMQDGVKGYQARFTATQLIAPLSMVGTNADAAAKAWDRVLTLIEKNDIPLPQIEVPDLVTLLGSDRARPLIQRILLLPKVVVARVSGIETQALARKIALDHISELKQAPWTLTERLEAGPLFEALSKKFSADPQSEAGLMYHLIGLVVQGKPGEALNAVPPATSWELSQAIDKAVDAGYGMQVFDFLGLYLPKHPESALWSTYISVAAQTSEANVALKLVQQTMAQPALSAEARQQVGRVLYRALLGVDKVDEGVAELRRLIQSPPDHPADNSGSDSEMTVDLQLARLGRLLKHPEWEDQGISSAKATLKEETAKLASDKIYQYQSDVGELASLLDETGHASGAEQILIDAVVAFQKADAAAKDPQMSWYPQSGQGADQMLATLALVYYNAGRWEDVLKLLRGAPNWSAPDLASLVATEPSHSEGVPVPCLGLMAARALAETGDVAQARKVLDQVLQADSGSDAAYELFLKIGEGDLVAKLGQLYRQDQFQERPLIWKAVLLLKQGKAGEAAAACKAAIKVDPSDGEEGKGDRMRVYAVMADVCEAQHDAKQAEFFRNVVKAIRLAENADDYQWAGLLTRAADMYNQALSLFSDAYCIQSRLARQLAELGRLEEAAVHYRKAFELMPVSFGRMESHCFGCERAFAGPTASQVAEKTFKAMLVKDPQKPQLYYLLGYLYMEEERYAESAANFHKAAELDPDYINAWKNILSDGQNYQLPPNWRDEAVFNVIRLDPAGKHDTPSLEKVRNLGRLWDVLDTASKSVPAKPASLFPLTATAASSTGREDRMEKMLPSGIVGMLRQQLLARMRQAFHQQQAGLVTPIDGVLQNSLIQVTSQGSESF